MDDDKILKEQEKLKRISAEIKRLEEIFKKIDIKTRKAVHSLIENAAFMAVTLEDLQAIINREGTTDRYQNGENQYGVKKSANVEVYNAMIKNHMGIMKQLTELIPKEQPEIKGDGFDDFVNGRDDM